MCVAVPVSVHVVQSRPQCAKTQTDLQRKMSQRHRRFSRDYIALSSCRILRQVTEGLEKIFDAETCILGPIFKRLKLNSSGILLGSYRT